MERRILLPTDFSDNAWSALVYALKLYQDEVCTFYLLNSTIVNVPIMSYHLSDKVVKNIEAEAKKELLELKDMAETSNANSNHSFDIIASSLDLKDSIEIVISKYDIDLIIMGTKGATGAKEFFFGTNTVHVINKINKCPVLVVPEEFDFVVPKQIAFATDFYRFYSDMELKPLKQLADLYNSKIRIVHINVEKKLNDIQEYNLEKLKSYLEDYEYSFHWMPKYEKKTIEINDFIIDLNIDIIAMVNYRNSFIERIIKEPVVNNIGFQPIIPFLVIPE